ncbi:MAG TPA: single-stranded-DNA-specific exonuclease RecJ [Gammaproteobacteria bacterium]|nr:single-stranded-DNA-specific exonuclease RecJ [Gammaproteobacteria bacterium]
MDKTILRRPVPEFLMTANLPPLLRRVYAARGIRSIDELEQSLKHLLPYSSLLGIEQAVTCLYQALSQQQHILILGDFDADGATSTALAVSALQAFGAQQVSYLVPNRFEYGYGLTSEIVEVAAERNPQLIVTVDNGISSIAGVVRANELGIQVLITDHHLSAETLPPARAIVNPNQPGCFFPSKNLAGVGVIFYVMLALRNHLRQVNWFAEQNLPEPNMSNLLDLVALGTVADVVPLDQNNRILVQQGLNRIRQNKARPGIAALLKIANRSKEHLVASDLGFALGPRLNAAGRLEDMSLGIACLLSQDPIQAESMALRLDALNKERREIEATMQQQAQSVLSQLKINADLPLGVCLHDSSWHQGVIGILASRIKDQLHRPVIAFASTDSVLLKGSARSINGVHIRDVLDAIAKKQPQLISKFGGHAMAAGLSLHQENYPAFCQAFAEEVARHISLDDIQGKITTDGELTAEHFCIEIADLLRNAGPWGQAFPEPLFDNYFYIVEQRIVGHKHLKLQLQLEQSHLVFDAIAFNIDIEKWPNYRARKIHGVYRLDVNEFRGVRNVQLMIEHLTVVEN